MDTKINKELPFRKMVKALEFALYTNDWNLMETDKLGHCVAIMDEVNKEDTGIKAITITYNNEAIVEWVDGTARRFTEKQHTLALKRVIRAALVLREYEKKE